MAKLWMTGRTGLAALALMAVAACGRTEAPTTTTASSGNPGELAPVNVADKAAYAEWLKANEIARTEVDFGSGTRAAAGSDAAAWALLPRGEVRIDGLRTWRLEIDRENFEKGGYLEFRQGKKVLYKDSTLFDPASSRFCEGAVPASVLASLKAGETVTWGVFYPDAKELNAVATFKVVNKPQVVKQIDKLEQNRLNARQSPEIKALARNQVLINNSLFSEALLGSMNLAATGKMTDPHVGEAFYKIVECMRRLDLEEAPLYDAAKALATAKGPNMAGANGNAFGGDATGGGRGGLAFEWVKGDRKELAADPIGDPAAKAKEMAKNTEQNDGSGTGTAQGTPEQGGSASGDSEQGGTAAGDLPTPAPVDPVDDGSDTPAPPSNETPDGPTSELEQMTAMAKEAAAAAQKARDEANASLQDAAAKMAEASTNVTEYTKQAHDPSATPAERAEAEAKAQYWARKLEEAQRQAVEARAAIEKATEAMANAEAQLKAIQNQTGENPAAGGPEVTKAGQELAKLQQQAAQAMTHANNLQKKYEELEAAGDPDAAMWKMQAEAARAVAQQMAKRAEDMRRALEVMEKTK
jgi:hypothetical protein